LDSRDLCEYLARSLVTPSTIHFFILIPLIIWLSKCSCLVIRAGNADAQRKGNSGRKPMGVTQ
jgi:hypothetical protein